MNGSAIIAVAAACSVVVAAFGFQQSSKPAMHKNVGINPGHVGRGTALKPSEGHELAEFSMGCFWGSEDTYRMVPGVVATAVGYTGGHTKNPTYQQVCTHTTGHAETVLVEYDPKVVSYKQLLEKFWDNHDGTQLNRQGPDDGDSYRSAIWTFSPDQAREAEISKALRQKRTHDRIVTTIKPVEPFWVAEFYHQQYHDKTGAAACPLLRTGG